MLKAFAYIERVVKFDFFFFTSYMCNMFWATISYKNQSSYAKLDKTSVPPCDKNVNASLFLWPWLSLFPFWVIHVFGLFTKGFRCIFEIKLFYDGNKCHLLEECYHCKIISQNGDNVVQGYRLIICLKSVVILKWFNCAKQLTAYFLSQNNSIKMASFL